MCSTLTIRKGSFKRRKSFRPTSRTIKKNERMDEREVVNRFIVSTNRYFVLLPLPGVLFQYYNTFTTEYNFCPHTGRNIGGRMLA